MSNTQCPLDANFTHEGYPFGWFEDARKQLAAAGFAGPWTSDDEHGLPSARVSALQEGEGR